MIDNNKVVAALRKVIDPDTGKDIIDSRKIQNLRIEGQRVSMSLVLPSIKAPYKSELIFACIGAIQEVYPDADVNVHPEAADGKQGSLPQIKNIVAIASGKGGVGKSTVSTNLAIDLQSRGFSVGLVDGDLYGPSIPTMLGLEGERPQITKIMGQNKMLPLESNGVKVISLGNIIDPEQAVVLRGPRLSGIIKQFLQEVLWPDLDFLIIDLPPGTGDIQLSLVQTVSVTGAIMVTTPQKVAVIDAVKAANMFRLESVNVPIIGVVENMSWFTPEELPEARYHLFGEGGGEELAKRCQTTFLGQIPLVASVGTSGDKGVPFMMDEKSLVYTPFKGMVDKFIERLEVRNEKIAPTKKVEVN